MNLLNNKIFKSIIIFFLAIFIFYACYQQLHLTIIISLILSGLIGVYIDFLLQFGAKSDPPLKVKILKKDNLLFVETVPSNLEKKFKRFFKNKDVITENEFDIFIIKNMKFSDTLKYFYNKQQTTNTIFKKISSPLSDKHLSFNQIFHISFYDNENNLKVIDHIGKESINEAMKTSFSNYVSETKKKGEKVYEKDVEEWYNSIK